MWETTKRTRMRTQRLRMKKSSVGTMCSRGMLTLPCHRQRLSLQKKTRRKEKESGVSISTHSPTTVHLTFCTDGIEDDAEDDLEEEEVSEKPKKEVRMTTNKVRQLYTSPAKHTC